MLAASHINMVFLFEQLSPPPPLLDTWGSEFRLPPSAHDGKEEQILWPLSSKFSSDVYYVLWVGWRRLCWFFVG